MISNEFVPGKLYTTASDGSPFDDIWLRSLTRTTNSKIEYASVRFGEVLICLAAPRRRNMHITVFHTNSQRLLLIDERSLPYIVPIEI